jgi:hypothetical protein
MACTLLWPCKTRNRQCLCTPRKSLGAHKRNESRSLPHQGPWTGQPTESRVGHFESPHGHKSSCASRHHFKTASLLQQTGVHLLRYLCFYLATDLDPLLKALTFVNWPFQITIEPIVRFPPDGEMVSPDTLPTSKASTDHACTPLLLSRLACNSKLPLPLVPKMDP